MPRISAANHVLVVGPGGGIRGGIDAVIEAHNRTSMWTDQRCELVATYAEGSSAKKLSAALKAYALCLVKMGSTRLVHIHLAGERSLLRKLPILMLARLFRKRIVVHVHASSSQSLFDKTPWFALRLAMTLPDRVIALSPSWADDIRKHFPAARTVVIPNPAIIHSVPEGLGHRPPIVLFVGKLEKRKGYSDLIQAAKYVLDTVPQARFIFAGHGELDEAKNIARGLGCEDAVQLLGWLPRQSLAALLDTAAVFCLPSYGEGVPMAMLEAMAHGLPVVTTPVGGIPDVIQSGVSGLLIEPGNPKALACALTRVLTNEENIRTRLGEAALLNVSTLCGSETVARMISALYDELCPGKISQYA